MVGPACGLPPLFWPKKTLYNANFNAIFLYVVEDEPTLRCTAYDGHPMRIYREIEDWTHDVGRSEGHAERNQALAH